MTGGAQAYPKAARLTKRSQYLRLNKRAGRRSSSNFLVLHAENGLPGCRLGITVTKKVAGAVGRNRIKRMVREAFRGAGGRLPGGLDLVVIARPGAARLSGPQILEELWGLWESLNQRRTPPRRGRA